MSCGAGHLHPRRVLASWVAIALLMMAIILGMFRFATTRRSSMSVVRLATGFLCGHGGLLAGQRSHRQVVGRTGCAAALTRRRPWPRRVRAAMLTWLGERLRRRAGGGPADQPARVPRLHRLHLHELQVDETKCSRGPRCGGSSGNFVPRALYTDGAGELYERHSSSSRRSTRRSPSRTTPSSSRTASRWRASPVSRVTPTCSFGSAEGRHRGTRDAAVARGCAGEPVGRGAAPCRRSFRKGTSRCGTARGTHPGPRARCQSGVSWRRNWRVNWR